MIGSSVDIVKRKEFIMFCIGKVLRFIDHFGFITQIRPYRSEVIFFHENEVARKRTLEKIMYGERFIVGYNLKEDTLHPGKKKATFVCGLDDIQEEALFRLMEENDLHCDTIDDILKKKYPHRFTDKSSDDMIDEEVPAFPIADKHSDHTGVEIKSNNAVVDYLRKRGVKYLFHFTPYKNVPSIMRNGLLPIKKQKEEGIEGEITDPQRLDRQPDASDFSISFPNYRMFYRKWSIEKNTLYAVMIIDMEILNEFDENNVAFCVENAATTGMQGMAFLEKTGLKMAEELFKDNDDEVRRRYNLPESYPTNPQAEIQIKGKIPPIAIKDIHVNEDEALKYLKIHGIDKMTRLSLNSMYFKPRIDYEYWSGNREDAPPAANENIEDELPW